MKTLRTKKTVLLDAQTNKKGIAVVKLEEFKFLGNASVVLVGYYEETDNINGRPGEPAKLLKTLPIKGSIPGRLNVKRVTLPSAVMDALFEAVDTSILKSKSFSDQLANVLTSATLIQLVKDNNYSNISEENVLTPVGFEGWELVNDQELIEETLD